MTAPGGASVIGRAIIQIIPAVQNFATSLRRQLHQATRSLRTLDREIRPVQRSLQFLARWATGIAPGIKLASLAFRALATEAIIGGIVALSAALYEASGALFILPAAAVAASSAMLTLKIGLFGVEDALKKWDDAEKFAEKLEDLSTNAQKALGVIDAMRPRLLAFREAIQDALFVNMDRTFTDLINTLLPRLQKHFTNLATTFNKAGQDLAGFARRATTLRDLSTVTGNIEKAFARLRPALIPAAQAFTDLVTVGSQFLPILANEVVGLTKKFANFVAAARASGQLQLWIEGGLRALRQMGQIVFNVGHALNSVLTTARQHGLGLLDNLEELSYSLRDFFASAKGQRELIHFLDQARSAAETLAPIIVALADTFFNHLLPVLTSFGKTIGPAVEQFIRALGQAIDIAAPGIQAFAQGFAQFIVAIIPALPAIAALVGALGQLVGVLSASLGPAIADVIAGIAGLLIPIIQALTTIMAALPAGFFKFITVLGVVIATIIGVVGALRGLIAFATLFATAFSGAAVVVGGLTTALGVMSKTLRTPLGLAITGVIAILGTFALSSDNAADSQSHLKSVAQELNDVISEQNGAINEVVRAKAAAQLEDEGAFQLAQRLGISTQQVTDAYLQQGTALEDLTANLVEMIKAQTESDKLFTSGGISGGEIDPELQARLQLLQTLQRLTAERDADAEATQRQNAATGNAVGVTGLYTSALNLQRAALDAVYESQRRDADAKLAQINADLAFQNQLAQTRTELAKGAKTLNIHTQEGRSNLTALTQLAQAGNQRVQNLRDQSASQAEVNKMLDANERAMIDLLLPFAKNREAARLLGIQMGLIPNVRRTVSVDTRGAQQRLKELQAGWNNRQLYWSVVVDTSEVGRSGFGGRFTENARGGPIRAGEWSWVGEEGPELVHFGRAGRVFSNRESLAMTKQDTDLSRFTGTSTTTGTSRVVEGGSNVNVNVTSQPEVKVYVDGKELRGIAVEVVEERDRQLNRIIRAGARSRA